MSVDPAKGAAGADKDPYMAKLGSEVAKGDGKADKEIKAEFHKVVEAAGSTVDLDVPGTAAKK
jgi:hypothetical protein